MTGSRVSSTRWNGRSDGVVQRGQDLVDAAPDVRLGRRLAEALGQRVVDPQVAQLRVHEGQAHRALAEDGVEHRDVRLAVAAQLRLAGLQPLGHRVERRLELAELGAAAPRHAGVEVVGGDAARRGGQAAQGGHEQAPAGRAPTARRAPGRRAEPTTPTTMARSAARSACAAAQLLDALLQRHGGARGAGASRRRGAGPRASGRRRAGCRPARRRAGAGRSRRRSRRCAPASASTSARRPLPLRHQRAQPPQLAGHVQARAAERVQERRVAGQLVAAQAGLQVDDEALHALGGAQRVGRRAGAPRLLARAVAPPRRATTARAATASTRAEADEQQPSLQPEPTTAHRRRRVLTGWAGGAQRAAEPAAGQRRRRSGRARRSRRRRTRSSSTPRRAARAARARRRPRPPPRRRARPRRARRRSRGTGRCGGP